jgi:hypothetical protein
MTFGNRRRSKRELRHAARLLVVLALMPSLLFMGPSSWKMLGSLLDGPRPSVAERTVERTQKIRKRLSLTDVAPPQRSVRRDSENAPHGRLARRWESLRAGSSEVVETRADQADLDTPAPAPVTAALPKERPVPVLAPELRDVRRLAGGTKALAQPKPWPSPPDPFVEPAIAVDPSRSRLAAR